MKYLVINNEDKILCESIEELYSLKKEYPQSQSYALVKIDDILEENDS